MNRYRITLKKEQLAVLEIDHELRPEFAAMLIARLLRDAWMIKDPQRPVAFETNSDWLAEKLVRVRNQWGEYQTFTFELKS